MTAGDEKWLAVVGNFKKEWAIWAWMTRILVWEEANQRVSRMFYKSVVQAVLLFRSDTWVLNPHIGRALRSFQHRVARRITRKQPRQQDEAGSEYAPLVAEMEEVVFEKIRVYILKRQDRVAQYIATRHMLDL